jgi:hypothetical protein
MKLQVTSKVLPPTQVKVASEDPTPLKVPPGQAKRTCSPSATVTTSPLWGRKKALTSNPAPGLMYSGWTEGRSLFVDQVQSIEKF